MPFCGVFELQQDKTRCRQDLPLLRPDYPGTYLDCGQRVFSLIVVIVACGVDIHGSFGLLGQGESSRGGKCDWQKLASIKIS